MSEALAYAPPRHFRAKLQRRVTQWRAARPATLKFERPILSITFDDFPRSAALQGAPILERHRAGGTYYASAGLAQIEGACGQGFFPEDLKRVAEAGHEIGCHTFAHRDCARLDAFDALHDLARNRDALAAMGHHAPLEALAYPYGETTAALKGSLPPRYRSARGILPGLNRGRVDLAQLRALPLFGEEWRERARLALKRAVTSKAWLIAFTHDVGDAPSPWGTSASDLDAFVAAARSAGFALLSVSAALDQAR